MAIFKSSGPSQTAIQNLLLNGNLPLFQRGTSSTVANGLTSYLADRWYAKNSLGTNGIITQDQLPGVSDGAAFGLRVRISTAPTALQTNGCELYQAIENQTSLQLYNKTASFQVKVKALANVTQVGIQFFYATSEIKLTTSIGSETLVTVNSSTFTTLNTGLQAIGTTQTTSGVVGVRIRPTAVSTGNLYDINNGFVVEQAMVAVAADTTGATFISAFPTFESELAACQRYYLKSYSQGTNPGTTTTGGLVMSSTNTNIASGVIVTGLVIFPAEMRTVSSPAYWDAAGNASKYTTFTGGGLAQVNNVGAIGGTTSSTRSFWWYLTLGASLTAAIHFAIDAEI